MRNDGRYIRWCFAQSKGIRLVKPSENLVKAYLEKSRNALKSMEINASSGIIDWAVSASYYARYFAVYSLLSKIGVKCEIHDCTIAVFSYLFGGRVSKSLVDELKQSKQHRIEVQYYTRGIQIDLNQLTKQTRNFVIAIEDLIDRLNSERASALQARLRALET